MHELKWEGVSGMHSATTLGEHTSPKRHDKERQHNPRYAPSTHPLSATKLYDAHHQATSR